eukprot:592379_1
MMNAKNMNDRCDMDLSGLDSIEVDPELLRVMVWAGQGNRGCTGSSLGFPNPLFESVSDTSMADLPALSLNSLGGEDKSHSSRFSGSSVDAQHLSAAGLMFPNNSTSMNAQHLSTMHSGLSSLSESERFAKSVFAGDTAPMHASSFSPVPPLAAGSFVGRQSSSGEAGARVLSALPVSSMDGVDRRRFAPLNAMSSTSPMRRMSAPSSDLAVGDHQTEGLRNQRGRGGHSREAVLKRKAELARQSRRRKKMYYADLEAKVKTLGAKLEEMQQKLARLTAEKRPAELTAEDEARSDEQERVKTELRAFVQKRPGGEAGSGGGLDESQISSLCDRFVANSRVRQSRIQYHLDRVEDCITPGLQVKFVLWGLDQSSEFYDKPDGLWVGLMRDELRLSDEQVGQLRAQQTQIALDRAALARTERTITELRAQSEVNLRNLHHRMDGLKGILSPEQLARFFVWVEDNKWCVEMLNSMWSNQSVSAPDMADCVKNEASDLFCLIFYINIKVFD